MTEKNLRMLSSRGLWTFDEERIVLNRWTASSRCEDIPSAHIDGLTTAV